MRILVYYPRYLVGDGGPTLAVRGWVRALRAAGADVLVLCRPAADPPADLAGTWAAIPHRGGGRWSRPVGSREALRGADVLLLHSGWVWHNVVAGKAAVGAGVPYVVVPHGAYDLNVLRRRAPVKRAWWAAFEQGLLSRASAIHVFFESEQQAIRALGYRGRFITVPHGATVPSAPTWDGGSGGYVLWLGRYDVAPKGLDVLLDAFALIPEAQRPLLRMHGPDHRGGRARIAQLIAELGLETHVEVRGPVYGDEKEDVLARAAAFVYPSRWDSHSVAVTEALARGVPCDVTETMHIAGALRASGAAFVAGFRADALATEIQRAVSPEAARVAAAGRAFCARELSWDACTKSFLLQLEGVLAGGVSVR